MLSPGGAIPTPVSSMSLTMTSSIKVDLELYEFEEVKHICKMNLGGTLWSPTTNLRHGVPCYEKVTIALDSGSDATVIPPSFAPVGLQLESGSQLWDAQGSQIRTSGYKEVSIELEGVCGERIRVKERGYFSDTVSQPLLSYRRLLKRGWVINLNGNHEPRLCHQQSGVSVPVKFKNDPLVVAGSIRRVFVRYISADIPAGWKTLGTAWTNTSLGYPTYLQEKRWQVHRSHR